MGGARNAEVTLDWADGTYRFRLPIEAHQELQEKTGAGPWYVMDGLRAAALAAVAGQPVLRDVVASYVVEPIRLGLIGGGMEPVKALKLVRTYVEARPLNENVQTAYAILAAAIIGVAEDAPPKKARAGKTTAKLSRGDKSGSRISTASEPPSD